MTALISIYSSDGCVGRCDAKCYAAKHPDCDCICGGLNHGAGLERAVANTRTLADTWLDEYHQQKGLDPTQTKSVIGREVAVNQISLFDCRNFAQAI